jgi:hypothetical protein
VGLQFRYDSRFRTTHERGYARINLFGYNRKAKTLRVCFEIFADKDAADANAEPLSIDEYAIGREAQILRPETKDANGMIVVPELQLPAFDEVITTHAEAFNLVSRAIYTISAKIPQFEGATEL